MTYTEYIQSALWQSKRAQRLEIDGHRCRQCGENGDNYRLEVHHWPDSYAKIPNETMHDLVTLCVECHDLLTDQQRQQRYESRVYVVAIEESIVAIRKATPSGLANVDLQADERCTVDHAQWADRKPVEQVRKGYEGYIE